MPEETIRIFVFQRERGFGLTSRPDVLPEWVRKSGKWVRMPVKTMLAYELAESRAAQVQEQIEQFV